jgi:hypothetical protein
MANYYDFVLGLVPVSMVSVTALFTLIGVELALAVPVGAGVSGVVVAHALFVNGPTADAPAPVADAPARAPGTMGAGAD